MDKREAEVIGQKNSKVDDQGAPQITQRVILSFFICQEEKVEGV